MSKGKEYHELLETRVNEVIDSAESPGDATRFLLRRFEKAITRIRRQMRPFSVRIRQAQSRIDKKKQDIAAWQQRVQQSEDAGNDRLATQARSRIESLDADLSRALLRREHDQEELQACEEILRRFEDMVQQVRRRKESSETRRHSGLSSNDFTPIPEQYRRNSSESEETS